MTTSPNAIELCELRALPAEYLTKLPMSSTFDFELLGIPRTIRVVGQELTEPRAEGDAVVFDALEWDAVVAGVRCDRLWEDDFAALCRAKWADPGLRVGLEDVLSGAEGDSAAMLEPRSFGAVLDRLGMTLVGVGFGTGDSEAAPAAPVTLAA